MTHARAIGEVEVPPAGVYRFEPADTVAEFSGKHTITRVRGRFAEVEGSIVIGERPEDSRVRGTIEADSLRTDFGPRDTHLMSADFLNVERWPTITFVSTALRFTGGNRFELDGDLTIKGITNGVTLRGEFLGTRVDPFGNVSARFSAVTRFEREDWDMTWNSALEAGGFLVGKTVTVEVEVEAFKQD
jgi:polyisoprenoid-binding protein YceI